MREGRLCELAGTTLPPAAPMAQARAALFTNLLVCRMLDLAIERQPGTDGARVHGEWNRLCLLLHRDLAALGWKRIRALSREDCDACLLSEAILIVARHGWLREFAPFLEETRQFNLENITRRMSVSLVSVFDPPETATRGLPLAENRLLTRARGIMKMAGSVESFFGRAEDGEKEAARMDACESDNGWSEWLEWTEGWQELFMNREARMERLIKLVELSHGQHLHLLDNGDES